MHRDSFCRSRLIKNGLPPLLMKPTPSGVLGMLPPFFLPAALGKVFVLGSLFFVGKVELVENGSWVIGEKGGQVFFSEEVVRGREFLNGVI